MKSLLAGLVVGMALSPSAPQAADVERVQRACASVRQEYVRPHFEAVPTSAWAADAGVAAYWPNHRNTKERAVIGVIDARFYELFCK